MAGPLACIATDPTFNIDTTPGETGSGSDGEEIEAGSGTGLVGGDTMSGVVDESGPLDSGAELVDTGIEQFETTGVTLGGSEQTDSQGSDETDASTGGDSTLSGLPDELETSSESETAGADEGSSESSSESDSGQDELEAGTTGEDSSSSEVTDASSTSGAADTTGEDTSSTGTSTGTETDTGADSGTSDDSSGSGTSTDGGSSESDSGSSEGTSCVPTRCLEVNSSGVPRPELFAEPNTWFAFPVSFADGPHRIVRAEIYTGEGSGTNVLAVFSDSGTRPDVELTRGSWSMSAINSWQGVDFDAIIDVAQNERLWIRWQPVSGAQANVANQGTIHDYVYSTNFGSSWFASSQRWMFRVDCCE